METCKLLVRWHCRVGSSRRLGSGWHTWSSCLYWHVCVSSISSAHMTLAERRRNKDTKRGEVNCWGQRCLSANFATFCMSGSDRVRQDIKGQTWYSLNILSDPAYYSGSDRVRQDSFSGIFGLTHPFLSFTMIPQPTCQSRCKGRFADWGM